ncbi:MAG: hypothetical protein R3E79_12775 [Caldilineaceae bacterium]
MMGFISILGSDILCEGEGVGQSALPTACRATRRWWSMNVMTPTIFDQLPSCAPLARGTAPNGARI